MEDKTSRLKRLLENDNWSHEDELWFREYVKSEDLAKLRSLTEDQFNHDLSESKPILEREKSEDILASIHRSIKVEDKKTFKINRQWLWAAATFFLGISIIAMYYNWQTQQQSLIAKKTSTHKPIDIEPGTNRAYLTLADGTRILLDNKKDGAITKQGDATIIKVGEMISYKTPGGLTNTGEAAYNTISTPRGGQYQIILADGSKVWLNAASSIRFPVAFSEKERIVEITGEAYFEVAKKLTSGSRRIPFLIKTPTQLVEVLGTHFNISAYADEEMVKTTLLEGSVRVTSIASNQVRVLVPGQQARVSPNQFIDVRDSNPEEVIAWKNGSFLFDDEELTSIMRKLSRWYDVDIVYKGKPENLYFGGMVSRSKNISSVLKIMESTKNVHFRIEGRRVIVMP